MLVGMSIRDGKEIVWALDEGDGKERWATAIGDAASPMISMACVRCGVIASRLSSMAKSSCARREGPTRSSWLSIGRQARRSGRRGHRPNPRSHPRLPAPDHADAEARKASIKSVPVEVTDGQFRVGFTRQSENPAIKAIELLPQPGSNHHGGMIVVGDAIEGANGGNEGGFLTCMDFQTGDVLWRDGGAPKGTLAMADGRLYLRAVDGTML